MSEVKRAGVVRTWVGAGLFLAGSLVTIYHANRSLSLDARGDELELASDKFFGLAQDPTISGAVHRHIETTASEAAAERIRYRMFVPSETGTELAIGCKAELGEPASEFAREKCNKLGVALMGYNRASAEFDETMDRIATPRNLTEVAGGGVLILAGVGVGASGIAAGRKQG